MKTAALPLSALEDLQWLQRFAVVMARDADEADDLVQDTLVAAWRDPPPDASKPLRPWLATVLRNRFRMRKRGELRREQRELHAPAVGAEARAPDREHERLEVLRILLGELQALPADDQKIIVRCFFEGESAADIGRALGIPSATIRSRIHRSLGRLRSSLDQRFGSRATWCAAVTMPPGSMAPVASNTARSSTMSITAKALLITALGGTTGLVGWVAMTPEPEPAAASTEAAAATPADADADGSPVVATKANDPSAQPDDPRAQWERRRESIRRALPPATEGAAPATAPTAELPAAARSSAAAHRAFRELVDACMEDLDTKSTGAVTLSMRELGAPGVGTIYESVEVVDASFDEPEVIECLTQSMYAWVGEAPAEAYMRDTGRTVPLGKPPAGDEKDAQTVGFIVGAHMGEVRFCESKADGEIAGSVTVTLAIGESGKPESSEAQPSALPQAVVECIVGATKRWQFPTTLAGKTFERDFVLPVPGRPPGPVVAD